MKEYSVLVTCRRGTDAVPPDPETLDRVAASLPGTDKWAQYPDASGRGEAIEFRFWLAAKDSVDAAREGTRLIANQLVSAGLADWIPERAHAATAEERVVETVRGISTRLDDKSVWSVLVRVAVPADARLLSSDVESDLRDSFGTVDCDIVDSGATWEIRVWCRSSDAVTAGSEVVEQVLELLRERTGQAWDVIRVHAAAPSERDRERYRGVYARL